MTSPRGLGASRSSYDNAPPALRQILQSFGPPSSSSRPPYLTQGSLQYAFAVHVLAGYSYSEACEELGVNPKTAERWRTQLRKEARSFFGREVNYEFAARYVIDSELRALCNK